MNSFFFIYPELSAMTYLSRVTSSLIPIR